MAMPDKRLLGALLASLALHLGLLFGPPLPLPQSHAPQVLEARLEMAAPPPLAIPQAKPRPRPSPSPHPVPPSETKQSIPATESQSPPAVPEPLADAESVPPVQPAPPAPATASTTLPERAELRYNLFKGDSGLNVGRVVQTWQRAGDAYTLTSTAEASGVFSLFFSGQHVQTSSGRIGPAGLQPESYSLQRGSPDKRDTARFDWDEKVLHLASEGQESTARLAPGMLDLLSFTYQFAFSLPETGDIRIDLTNGRKLDSYRYRIVAEEALETPLGNLKTVHLSKLHDPGEEGTEIWLGVEYHYLPVKIRQIDKKGGSAEQVISEIRYP